VKAVLKQDADDELAPLPTGPAPRLRTGPRQAPRKVPSKLDGAKGEHNTDPPVADDFSFLNGDSEGPKEDLKRPSF
jgi:hypothetical protein